ncbi:response regulator [Phenylobacterium sp.]|uniref:response regulator n=1 Tax=Phenylobacterium sp. TaxID=1871053 RepID=UPI00286CB9CC|nr:response regulator [Phenylobacterium sp.]
MVDDDPMMVELLTTRLELAGYHSCYARNGRDALERLPHVRLAAIVLDINMPELDGFGVLERLRDQGSLKYLPTMVLTARNQPDDVKRAISLGARDYLAKPFQDQTFLVRVARLVGRPKPAPTQGVPVPGAPELWSVSATTKG